MKQSRPASAIGLSSAPMTAAARTDYPALSVIVPACGPAPALGECEAAIRSQLGDADELIVQRTPDGAGPALARNAAAERARGALLVFVDADVVLTAGALERIRDRFTRPGAPDALFGSYDDAPRDPGLVSRYRNLLHHHVHTSSPGPAVTFWAGLGAVRAEAFAAVGGFDASRFLSPSVEDVELGMRMHDAGMRIELDPAITGKHLKRWTLAAMLWTDHARRGRPWARLLLQRGGPPPSALNLTPDRRLSALTSAITLTAALSRRPALALPALAAVAALNVPLLRLLGRRGGPRLAAAGLGLQVLHETAAASALPVAAAQHALDPGGRLS